MDEIDELNAAQVRFTLGNPEPLVDETVTVKELEQLCRESSAYVEMHRCNTLLLFEINGAKERNKKWSELNQTDLKEIYHQSLRHTMTVENQVLKRERYAQMQRGRRKRRQWAYFSKRHARRFAKKLRLLGRVPDNLVNEFVPYTDKAEVLYSEDSDYYELEEPSVAVANINDTVPELAADMSHFHIDDV